MKGVGSEVGGSPRVVAAPGRHTLCTSRVVVGPTWFDGGRTRGRTASVSGGREVVRDQWGKRSPPLTPRYSLDVAMVLHLDPNREPGRVETKTSHRGTRGSRDLPCPVRTFLPHT